MAVRTTIVLDDDVIERLHQESRLREISFREALNGAVREGLLAAEQRRQEPATFQVEPFSVGLRQGLTYDSVSSLLEIAEGESAR
jgi:hypothetical protein